MENEKPEGTDGDQAKTASDAAGEATASAEPAPEAAKEGAVEPGPEAAEAEAANEGKAAPDAAAASDAEAASPAEASSEPAAVEPAEPVAAAEPTAEPAAPADAAAEASPAPDAAPAEAAPAEPAEAAPAAPEPEPEAEPPHIDSITPGHGPVRGGTRVEIAGKRFVDGCTVRIGDADVTVTFESDSLLVVTSPERPTFGFADVRVTNPDGKSEARVNGFSYDIPPLPETVKPDALGVRGGTVRVFGEAFVEGLTVTINGQPAVVAFKGEDCIEVTIPAGEAGPVELTITNPDGQSAVLAGKLRLSEGPVIESISPNVGLPTGGTRVTISGRGFARGCTVTLFGELAPEVTFDSEKKISFVAPAHDAGQGAVRITNPDGLTTVQESAFEYRAAAPPVVTQLSPASAWATGGSRVIVSGNDFVEGCTATIGGKDAQAKWKNGGLVEVMVPAGDVGAVELVVTNPDGQTSTTQFTYERVPTPPKLISVTPNRGPTHGNVTVMFAGDNFDEQTVVRIAEVRTTIKVLSKTEMEVIVPPRVGEGPVAIELTSGEGVTVRSEEAFYYNDRPPPKVTGVAPNQGPTSGDTRVSIEGDGFTQDCFVRIGRERPKSITIKGPNLIEIVTPPCKITGFVDIEVGTNQTGSSVAKNMFRFIPLPVPVIDGVSPNRGRVEGGSEMSITGKHLNAAYIVSIGGKQVKFKVISSDLIECKTPPGTDGQMVDVSVKNSEGKEAVSRRAFAYDGRYKA